MIAAIVCVVSYVLAFAGLIALLQSLGWMPAAPGQLDPSTRASPPARARVAVFLAPVGVLLLGVGLLGALVPGFWG